MVEIFQKTGHLLKDTVSLTESAVFNTASTVTDVIKTNSVGFLKFLVDRGIFQTAVAVLISNQLSVLTNALTIFIISPITKKISGGASKSLSEWTITIFTIEFKIGLLIQTLINFLLILFVIYHIWKIVDLQNYGFINQIIGVKK